MQDKLLSIVGQFLQDKAITYEVMECDPELADTAAFCEHYGFEPSQSANTIMVVSKTETPQYAACVVLATTKLDVNKKVCQLLSVKKASFAPMDVALQLSKMEYGGVTAFGLPASIPVFVDAAVMEQSEVVMGGGNRSSKLLLSPQELLKITGAQVIDGLAKPKEY